MKTRVITFVTRYFKRKINIRVSKVVYDKLVVMEDPMYAIVEDRSRHHYGYNPFYLTKSQIKRLDAFTHGMDCIDSMLLNQPE